MKNLLSKYGHWLLLLFPLVLIIAGASGCTTSNIPKVRTSFVMPPASKLTCPADPAPPGKPGDPVSSSDDIAWQLQRDRANAECRGNISWLHAFFDWVAKHYPVTSLDIPQM